MFTRQHGPSVRSEIAFWLINCFATLLGLSVLLGVLCVSHHEESRQRPCNSNNGNREHIRCDTNLELDTTRNCELASDMLGSAVPTPDPKENQSVVAVDVPVVLSRDEMRLRNWILTGMWLLLPLLGPLPGFAAPERTAPARLRRLWAVWAITIGLQTGWSVGAGTNLVLLSYGLPQRSQSVVCIDDVATIKVNSIPR